MIAVMKAGSVFISLDAARSKQRIKSPIREIGTGLVLCSAKYHDTFTRISDKTIIVGEKTVESYPTLTALRAKL